MYFKPINTKCEFARILKLLKIYDVMLMTILQNAQGKKEKQSVI